MTAPVEIPGHARLASYYAHKRRLWLARCECGWSEVPFVESFEEHIAEQIQTTTGGTE